MPKFIRVTKDNRNKDRGFIAVDAICAVFENQDAHNTEIMTMDGFWYEVVDGIEKVYEDVIGNGSKPLGDTEAKQVQEESPDPNKGKMQFAKRKRFMSPAVSEDAVQKSHEEEREFKRGSYVYPKKGYGQKKYARTRISHTGDFPSGEGEGQHRPMAKAVDFTPHEPEGL